jgi:hypothetical protein
MEGKKHKEIAEKIAKIKKSKYHSDKGVDIRTPTQAIEVEVNKATLNNAKKQLEGSTKIPYIAVPKRLIKYALETTKGTRFGVMDENANIIKRGRSRRK